MSAPNGDYKTARLLIRRGGVYNRRVMDAIRKNADGAQSANGATAAGQTPDAAAAGKHSWPTDKPPAWWPEDEPFPPQADDADDFDSSYIVLP